MLKKIAYWLGCLTVTWMLLGGATLLPAAVVIQSQVVSGKILKIYDNQAVMLDNGTTYRPSHKGLVPDVLEGETITLRYVIEGADSHVYIEYAPGLNSLSATPVPAKLKDGKMK